MMVSFIQSNYMGFGSGIVVPGTTASACRTAATASRWTKAGHRQPGGPGKRPFHTIIPAFLTKDGQPVMSYGVMGGNMQPQGHMQTLVRMLDYGQNPQAACDAPRWRYNAGLEINVESAHARGRPCKAWPTGPPHGSHQRQLPGLWRRPVHLARWATRRWRAMWPPATRAATGRRLASDRPPRLPLRVLRCTCQRRRRRPFVPSRCAQAHREPRHSAPWGPSLAWGGPALRLT
jgi:hypothetical protein